MRKMAILALAVMALTASAAQGESSAMSAVSAESASSAVITGSGVIRGVVVDEGGKPVVGALVVEAEARDYQRFLDRGLDVVTTETWESKKFAPLRKRRVISEQRTDAAGRFEFAHLFEGDYVVAVLDAVLPQQAGEVIRLESGHATAEVTLKQNHKPAGFLAGRLVKPDGTPLGAGEIPAIFVMQFQNAKIAGNQEIRVDGAGRFYLNLKQIQASELSRTIYLAVPGYKQVEFELKLDPDKSYEQEVKLTAEKDDAELLGKILLPDGQPAAGVSVEPYAEEPWPGYRAEFFMFSNQFYYLGDSQAVVTGSDGTFRLPGLRPGTYGLMAQTERPGIGFKQGTPLRPGLARCGPTILEKVSVAESQKVGGLELRLAKYGKLKITVTDAATGRPLAGAQVGIYRAEQKGPLFRVHPGVSLKTDAQGRAQAEGLYPCKYNVTIGAAKHQTLTLNEEGAAALESGGEVDITVPLPTGAEGEEKKTDKAVS